MKHPHNTVVPWSTWQVRQNQLLHWGGAAGADAGAGDLSQTAARVLALTAGRAAERAKGELGGRDDSRRVSRASLKVIEGDDARRLGQAEKWELLSPFLKQYGREGTGYATLQTGMEYFITETGYVAYTRVRHPLWARAARRIVFSDPICAPEELPNLIQRFLARDRRAAFGVISDECAAALRPLGFKVNCVGCEPLIPIQTYNTQGNWKELDLIKRARNESRREGISIREEDGASLRRRQEELKALSAQWIRSKKINDREIWLYARRPVFDHEEGVRKLVAYDKEQRVAGFAFYDPMYREGEVFGYSANIVRCDELRFGRLATAIHLEAMERFKAEGKQVLNLLLAPFAKLDRGNFNDDWGARLFFQLSARFGNAIYNFRGLSFHKSKYRGVERPLYFASNRLVPSLDIYLAFASAGLADGWLATFGKLAGGMLAAGRNNNRN